MEKAIDILLEAFVNNLEIKTAKQYKQVCNALAKKDVFKTDAEKNFLTLVVKLIANNRKDDCIRLINLVKYSVSVYNWGKQRSYESYCKKLTVYLEDLLKSVSKSKEAIKSKIASACTIPKLSYKEESWLKEASTEYIVYLHEQLITKFTSRLGSQDRISGNKVWLPLNYIAKLYKKDDKTKDFRDWLRKMAESIFVHYEDENNKIKSVQFKARKVFLVFEKNTENKKNTENTEVTYDVYVAFSANNKCYRAYTPTGEGNTKVAMTVKDISDIAIDHVKPIDQTLRDLQKRGKIPNLEKVSESFKKMKGLSDKGAEKELLDELYNELKEDKDCKGNDGICHLTDELNRIKNDGVLRLMVSDYNSKKSNSSTYKKIIKIKNKNTYYGILGKVIIDGEDEEKERHLYYNLKEQNAPMRVALKELNGTEVQITKAIIDYI